MPTYKIIFEKAAQKFLDKQDRTQRIRLYKAIFRLPNGTDIKKLKGSNLYRLRVGDCRVLYSIDDGVRIIAIENIDNRGDVYKGY
jgi:mRNA interferase RelE/StbE